MPRGTNADGTENPDYCGWCYQGGKFTGGGLDEVVERNVSYLVRIKRLYPEQEARAEFPLQGLCRLHAYGSACGLVEL